MPASSPHPPPSLQQSTRITHITHTLLSKASVLQQLKPFMNIIWWLYTAIIMKHLHKLCTVFLPEKLWHHMRHVCLNRVQLMFANVLTFIQPPSKMCTPLGEYKWKLTWLKCFWLVNATYRCVDILLFTPNCLMLSGYILETLLGAETINSYTEGVYWQLTADCFFLLSSASIYERP